MEFILHYLWPSIRVCFSTALLWITIITILISELYAILVLSWGILLLPVFAAIDFAVLRAWCNYEEDKERIENGWLPKHRGK